MSMKKSGRTKKKCGRMHVHEQKWTDAPKKKKEWTDAPKKKKKVPWYKIYVLLPTGGRTN